MQQFTDKLILFSCAIIFFGGSFSSFAQTRAELDSLRSEASTITYNNPELAIEKGLSLYKLAKKDPSTQIGALIIVANGYAVLKNHDKVLEYAFQADSIAKNSKIYTDRIRVLGFIGGEYQRLNLSSKALNYLDQAYEISVSHPLPDSLKFLQGNILFVKGLIQKDNLGCEYALQYFKQAEEVFKNNISSNAINASVAIASNKIGDCNFEMKDYKKAKENYEEAIVYAKKINATKNIAYSELGLANILSTEGKNGEAIQILERAIRSIENVNDIGINSEIYKSLSENYAAIGNAENANKYTSLYLAEQDKLLSEEKKSLNKVVNDLSSENVKKRERQKDKYNYLFLFFGIVLLLVILIVVKKIIAKRRKIFLHKEELKKSSKNKK
ncbi:tetratricopeptide repeat protein [Aequorivita soesokkakensis]|nr:tetratricopeptide repeat protein [Aequorivita soesokkakensis]